MPHYRKTIADEFGLKLNDTKLVLMLRDKENYVVHYRNLQFYLNQGLKLRNVHRVLECDQSIGWSCISGRTQNFGSEPKTNSRTSTNI